MKSEYRKIKEIQVTYQGPVASDTGIICCPNGYKYDGVFIPYDKIEDVCGKCRVGICSALERKVIKRIYKD